MRPDDAALHNGCFVANLHIKLKVSRDCDRFGRAIGEKRMCSVFDC